MTKEHIASLKMICTQRSRRKKRKEADVSKMCRKKKNTEVHDSRIVGLDMSLPVNV